MAPNLSLGIAAFLLLSIPAALHALVNKRDPRAATGWIAICLLFPFAGPVLYFLFGVNRVRTKAQAIRPGMSTQAPRKDTVPPPNADLSLLFRVSEKVTRRHVVGGNRVRTLESGDAAYEAMLAAIASANRCVFLSTYIFRMDGMGLRFIEELSSAAARGVDVRVLVDGVGAVYSLFRTARDLKRRGVKAHRFLPPRLLPPSFLINMRNHRKILAVDGRIAFAGGMNIEDRHLSQADPGVAIRDLHFQFVGPVVHQLEEVFLEDWIFTVGEGDFPDLLDLPNEPWSPVSCRAVADGPDENLDKLAVILTGAVSAARERVFIMTPYFLPSREMISALQSASLRGVQVDIVLPEKTDLPFVEWATRKLLWELLIWGVRVHYQPGSFDHTKLFLVDGRYSLVGSANVDPRSLRLNFEVAVEVYDETFTGAQEDRFVRIRDRSHRITLEEMDARRLPVRIRDAFFWLFSPYM